MNFGFSLEFQMAEGIAEGEEAIENGQFVCGNSRMSGREKSYEPSLRELRTWDFYHPGSEGVQYHGGNWGTVLSAALYL